MEALQIAFEEGQITLPYFYQSWNEGQELLQEANSRRQHLWLHQQLRHHFAKKTADEAAKKAANEAKRRPHSSLNISGAGVRSLPCTPPAPLISATGGRQTNEEPAEHNAVKKATKKAVKKAKKTATNMAGHTAKKAVHKATRAAHKAAKKTGHKAKKAAHEAKKKAKTAKKKARKTAKKAKKAKKTAKKKAKKATKATKTAKNTVKTTGKKTLQKKAKTTTKRPISPYFYFIIFCVCVSLFLVVWLVLLHLGGAGRLGRGYVIDRGRPRVF
jgi:cobalamin biosynthesis Mg chelatase CobN